jgi:hypothetical protein
MVNITIYIEGVPSENTAVLTIDNSAVFRENFHQLFSQKLSSTEFNLRIKPFGSITQTLCWSGRRVLPRTLCWNGLRMNRATAQFRPPINFNQIISSKLIVFWKDKNAYHSN